MKFKVGDIISNRYFNYEILEILSDHYIYKVVENSLTYSISFNEMENLCSLVKRKNNHPLTNIFK